MIELELGCARVVFTDRRGGRRYGPFEALNLATHVGDDPATVDENYRQLATDLGLRPPDEWARPLHVHGADVIPLGGPLPPGTRADGTVTATPGLPLVALGADCAPVALAGETAVGAVHVGWRGLVAGVLTEAVRVVGAFGSGPVRAAVGPHICPACYEFGEAALEAAVAALGPAVAARTVGGRPAFDLGGGIQEALRHAGVGEVVVVPACTVESSDHYSFRRDGRTGRQGVVVVKTA